MILVEREEAGKRADCAIQETGKNTLLEEAVVDLSVTNYLMPGQ